MRPVSALLATILLAPVAAAHDELHRLEPGDTAANDRFGAAVAVDGALCVVGADREDEGATDGGAAYVFEVATGMQLAKLVAADAALSDRLGWSVSLSGLVAAAGAPFEDSGLQDSGAVYLFRADTGAQIAKLVPPDPSGGKEFGSAVAIHGTRLLVGAPKDHEAAPYAGAAYLFERSGGAWSLQAKLVASDAASFRELGNAVALNDEYALVACARDDEHGTDAGAVYVFDARTGAELAKLAPSVHDRGDRFGTALALDGTTAVISTPLGGVPYLHGVAFAFDLATGQQTGILEPVVGDFVSGLGASVALSGGRAVLGGVYEANGAGAAYGFDLASGQQIARLAASDAAPSDLLGAAAAASGTTLVLGAPGARVGGVNSGAAYLFDLSVGTALAYCSGDGSGTDCPCLNAGAPGHGCASSASADGARLAAEGSPCVADDALVLHATSSRPGQPGLFFQGANATLGGDGLAFGDGLRCASGSVVRLEVATANGAGSAASTVPIAAAGGAAPGDVLRYQWWYRDPGASPCGTGFNLSNGLELAWAP